MCFSYSMLKYLIDKLGKMPFYAVARGRQTGVYKTWAQCEEQVKGFTGAIYKKFPTHDEANLFVQDKIASSLTQTVGLKTKQSGRPEAKKVGIVKTVSRSAIRTEEHNKPIVCKKQYGEYNFPEDSDGFVHVYTDGSCENNGNANAIAGYGVYFDENHPLNIAAPVIGPATNNRGEIQAAIKAIKLAVENGITKLCINSDSKFVMQSATEWMAGWKKRGWKLAGGGPVKNEIDFKKLDAVITENPSVEIRWNYVPAHTGIFGNERADELAKEGGQSYNKIIPLARYAPYSKKKGNK